MTSKILNKGDIRSKVEVLKQSPSFVHLDEDELNEIANLATPGHFAKGAFIFQEGDPPDFFYVVQQGRVKLVKTSPSGKSVVCFVAACGDTLHASVLFDPQPRWLSAQAMDEVTVLCVAREEYLSFIANYPGIYESIVRILNEQSHGLMDRLVSMVSDNVELRLTNVLYTLFTKFGTSLFFTCEELADLAGTTLETTSRTLSRLKQSHVLSSGRGRLIILDEEKLKLLSGGTYNL